MTKIANPIYDVVFKYLMSDNKIAKLLISDLLGEKSIHLNYVRKNLQQIRKTEL